MEHAFTSSELREEGIQIVKDLCKVVSGDRGAIPGLSTKILSLPFFIQNLRFWDKVERFIEGSFLSEYDGLKFSAILADGKNSEDDALRLISIIDRCETNLKIRYIINATRSILTGKINRSKYFRIMKAICDTLEEDLAFLGEEISKENMGIESFICSPEFLGLQQAGLAYRSVQDSSFEEEAVDRYSFTQLAKDVSDYAINYENPEKKTKMSKKEQRTEIRMPTISTQDIEEMLH